MLILPSHSPIFDMSDNSGKRVARGIHKLANATITLNDGTSVPCHHSGFDTESRMYSFGHSHKKTIHTNIVIPSYDKSGVENMIYDKISVGDTVRVTSLYRVSLSQRLRVATKAQDEASVTVAAEQPN